MVFLPGAVGAAGFWKPVGSLLPARWTKRYLSWPGLGNEPPDPSVRGIEDLANIVKDELGEHGEPADLVAQSMGGVVAVRAAARWPDQVRRLVLVATSGGLDIASLGGADWRQDYRREFPGAQRWVTAHAPGHIDGIEGITAPALLVWGDADPISPLPVGQRLAALLPAAVLKVIPGGTHAMAVEQAPAVAALIREHLGQGSLPRVAAD